MNVFKSCRRIGTALCLFVLLTVFSTFAEESVDGNPAPHKTSGLIVSPLFGWVENVSNSSGTSDVSPEYGLFVMYANPRVVINNTTFFSDVNQSVVWGNIASFNLYGDPKAKLTWYLGASYVWHRVETQTVEIEINEPLGKVGVVWRIPDLHLSLNPYVGYAQQTTVTKFPSAWHLPNDRNRSDIVVYGVSAYWRWRMLHANAKYYLANDLDHDTFNHNFRIWCSAMFNESLGVIARLEYEEQNTTKDTSLLFGPVFVF
ncbi:MAG: hypothetical protein H8E68_00220 [Kiritimatiellaeota bacterium]|nr:hypothetical protein [Kiritimatiellota bacterium]